MGYDDQDRREEGNRDSKTDFVYVANTTVAIAVRLVGVFVLLVGLWSAVTVIQEAWRLYREPGRIERLAAAIEQGSRIGDLLTSQQIPTDRASPGSLGAYGDEAANQPGSDALVSTGDEEDHQVFKITYFIAWVIGLLLLMLIGRLSIWVIKTGGELALYDAGRGAFARASGGRLRKSLPASERHT